MIVGLVSLIFYSIFNSIFSGDSDKKCKNCNESMYGCEFEYKLIYTVPHLLKNTATYHFDVTSICPCCEEEHIQDVKIEASDDNDASRQINRLTKEWFRTKPSTPKKK